MNSESSFVQDVLSHVQFKEAHADIRRELESHVAEIRDSYADIIKDETQLSEQVRRRMGDSAIVGTQLDELHRPRFDWALIAACATLLVMGLAVMSQLGFLASQSLWVLMGLVAAACLAFVRPGEILKFSPIGFVVVLIVTVFSFFSSTYSDGQPYLKVAGLSIKIIDLSAALFVIFVPGMLRLTEKSKPISFIIYPFLEMPLFIYSSTGSAFPMAVYGLALLGMVNAFSTKLAPLLSALVLGLASFAVWPTESQFAAASSIEAARQMEAHTDFVLNSMYAMAPLMAAVTVACALLVCLRVFSMTQVVRSREGRTIAVGNGIFLSLATLWSSLASLGFLPVPAAGVNLPLVSYGGSLMVAQLAMLGIALGVYRRKNLSDLMDFTIRL